MHNILLVISIVFLLSHCSKKIKIVAPAQKNATRDNVESKNYTEVKKPEDKQIEVTQEDGSKEIEQEITKEDNNQEIVQEDKQIDTESKKPDIPKARSFDINPDDIVFGDINSPTILVEYFSPTCTHCAYYKEKVFPTIKKNYIDTNKIAYVMREFIANRQDKDASILIRCTNNKEDFLKFVIVILGQQENWAYSGKYREMLTNIGKLGGISAESYENCLNNEKILDTLMSNSKFVMTSPRFIGTPAFFINGVQFTKPFSIDLLSAAIEDAIKNDSKK